MVANYASKDMPSRPANRASTTASVSAASGPPSPSPWGNVHGGRQHSAHPSGHRRPTALNPCLFHIRFGDSAGQCSPACSRWHENRPRDVARQHVFATDTCLRDQPATTTGTSSPPSWPAQLGLIIDDISRRRCLLDTGSQVYLWPPSPSSSRLPVSRVRLTAANGTPIKAFEQLTWQIKIGGKSYSFIFLVAQVSRPILGPDFLQRFNMMIDLSKRQLIHSGVSTRFLSVSSKISGINVIYTPSSFTRLLQDFPEITDATLASSTPHHGVECFISTNGLPIKTSPRWLTPKKLRIARQYFEMMCAAGICQRSDSP